MSIAPCSIQCRTHGRLLQQTDADASRKPLRGLPIINVEGRRNVAGEHQALVDAALVRDADRLVGTDSRPLRETTEFIIA